MLDEGLLFRTNEEAFVRTKRKLLDECNLWCVVSLPGGVFTAAGAGVKTNLFFFTKGEPTEKIWYYDLSGIKVGKKTPLTSAQFADYFEKLPTRANSEVSWTIDFIVRKQTAFEQAAPHRKEERQHKEEIFQLKEKLPALKKDRNKNAAKIEKVETAISLLDKQAREAAAKAQAIEDAVYDLKAVNPSVKPDTDTRLPAEIIASIEKRGEEVANALRKLKALGELEKA